MKLRLASQEDLAALASQPVNTRRNGLAQKLGIDPTTIRTVSDLLEVAAQAGYQILAVALDARESIRNLSLLADFMLTLNKIGLPSQVNVEKTSDISKIERFEKPGVFVDLEITPSSESELPGTSFTHTTPDGIVLFLSKKIEASGALH